MSLRFRVLGVVGVVLSSSLLTIGCSTSAPSAEPESTAADSVVAVDKTESALTSDRPRHQARESIAQFGTLDQLNRAILDGPTTAGEVGRSGDFGVGTYNALDGEMIVLDGVVYRFTSDGVLRVAKHNDLVPFAAVTRFRTDQDFVISSPLADYAGLQGFVSNALPDQNRLFALKVHGTFTSIKTRAPRRQVKPYPTLAEATKTQVEFTNTNIRGTLVGFRLPAYLGTANATGYHFHFVSDNHQVGGHVLDVAVNWATVEAQNVEHLQLNVADED